MIRSPIPGLARAARIATPEDLRGQRVGSGNAGSGTRGIAETMRGDAPIAPLHPGAVADDDPAGLR